MWHSWEVLSQARGAKGLWLSCLQLFWIAEPPNGHQVSEVSHFLPDEGRYDLIESSRCSKAFLGRPLCSAAAQSGSDHPNLVTVCSCCLRQVQTKIILFYRGMCKAMVFSVSSRSSKISVLHLGVSMHEKLQIGCVSSALEPQAILVLVAS